MVLDAEGAFESMTKSQVLLLSESDKVQVYIPDVPEVADNLAEVKPSMTLEYVAPSIPEADLVVSILKFIVPLLTLLNLTLP